MTGTPLPLLAAAAAGAVQQITGPDAGNVLAQGAIYGGGALLVAIVGWQLKRLVTTTETTAKAVTELHYMLVGPDGKNGLRSEVRKTAENVERLRRRTHRLANRLYAEQLKREAAEQAGRPPLQPGDVGAPDRRAARREA